MSPYNGWFLISADALGNSLSNPASDAQEIIMATLTEVPTRVKTRTESDSMGKIEVASNVYWGAQTQRSLLHFNIGRDTMPPELIHAFGTLKKACALVNQDLGKLPPNLSKLIVEAADEVTPASWITSSHCASGRRVRARRPT